MGRNVIGIKLIADARQFNRAMNSAVRNFTSLDYVATRAGTAAVRAVRSSMDPNLGADQAKAMEEKWRGRFTAIGMASGAALTAGIVASISGAILWETAFAPALREASEFQREMARMSALAGKDFEGGPRSKFREASLGIGLKTQFSGAEVARSMSNLMTAGLTRGQALKTIEPMIEAIEASFNEIAPERAAKIFAIAFDKFDFPANLKDTGDKARYLSDMLFQIKKSSRIEFKEILSFLDSMQSGPKILSMTMQETFTLGTAMMKLGTNSRRTGMQINALGGTLSKLQRVFTEGMTSSRFGKIIKDANELYGLAGVGFDESDFVDHATGKARSGFEILKNISAKTSKLAEVKGSPFAQAAMHALLSEKTGFGVISTLSKFKLDIEDANGELVKTLHGLEAVDAIFEQMSQKSIAGQSARGAEAYRNTWEGINNIIEGVVSTIQTLIGEDIIKFLSPGLSAVQKGLTEFAVFFNEAPAARALFNSLIFSMGAWLIGMGVLLTVLGAVGLILGLMGPGIAMLAGAIGLSVPVLMGITVAATAAIAALSFLSMIPLGIFFKGISEYINLSRDSLDDLSKMWTIFTSALGEGQSPHGDEWESLSGGQQDVINNLFEIINALKSFWKGFTDAIDWSFVTTGIDNLVKSFSTLGEALGLNLNFAEGKGDSWAKFGKVLAGAFNLVIAVVGFAIDTFSEFLLFLSGLGAEIDSFFGKGTSLRLIMGGIATVFLLAAGAVASMLSPLMGLMVIFRGLVSFFKNVWLPIFKFVNYLMENFLILVANLLQMAGLWQVMGGIVGVFTGDERNPDGSPTTPAELFSKGFDKYQMALPAPFAYEKQGSTKGGWDKYRVGTGEGHNIKRGIFGPGAQPLGDTPTTQKTSNFQTGPITINATSLSDDPETVAALSKKLFGRLSQMLADERLEQNEGLS